jgi:hypothetical protein
MRECVHGLYLCNNIPHGRPVHGRSWQPPFALYPRTVCWSRDVLWCVSMVIGALLLDVFYCSDDPGIVSVDGSQRWVRADVVYRRTCRH